MNSQFLDFIVNVLFQALFWAGLIVNIEFIFWFIFGRHKPRRRVIWHRLILCSLAQGVIFYYLNKRNNILTGIEYGFSALLTDWIMESDDDHKKRKRRRMQAWQILKDFKIYGWQPGPSAQRP